jgi:tetratricopeptide (TPR) repeat protein
MTQGEQPAPEHARRPDGLGGSGLGWTLGVGAVLLLAFVLRLVYVLQSRSSPLFDAPQMDAAYHLQWARAFAAGEGFQTGEPFYRAPLYSWFLGAVLALFGDGLLAPRIAQAVLGTFTAGLTFLIGARAFDRRTGLLAALGVSTSWILIYFDGELLIPTLAVPLQLLALWLSLRLADDRRPVSLALAGAGWGLAAIARPTVLLIVPFVALWAAWRAAPGTHLMRRRASALALVLAGFAVPVLPLTLHNALVAKDPVLISSTGGVNLWIGNNPVSDGSSAVLPGARTDLWGGIQDATLMAEAEAGRKLRPSGVSRHYARKARAHMLAHPGHALRHLAWKLRLAWTSWELGNNTQPEFFARRFGPVVRWLPLSFGILAPLGLVGFVLLTSRRRELFPLWIFLPVQTLGIVLFFVNARFRVPLVPVLCLFATHALLRGLAAFHARSWAPLSVGVVATALLSVVVNTVPKQVDTSDAASLCQLGILAMQREDVQGATQLFEQALAENQRYPYAHRGLGAARMRAGELDVARRHFEAALALLPCDLETLVGLAELALLDPENGDLCAITERLLQCAPQYAGTHYYLGRCLLDPALAAERAGAPLEPFQNDLVRAREAFRTAFAMQRDFANSLLLGQAHLLLGEFAEASLAFAEADGFLREPDPGGFFWMLQEGRVRAWKGAALTDEARAHAEDLWRRFQTDAAHNEAARAVLLEARRP